MVRRKAYYPANSGFGLCSKKAQLAVLFAIFRGEQSGKIIIEDKCFFVIRVYNSVRALVSGAQITGWIVSRKPVFGCFLHLPQPGPPGPVWRNQHPFAC